MYTGYAIITQNIPLNTHEKNHIRLLTPGLCYITVTGDQRYIMHTIDKNGNLGIKFYYTQWDLQTVWEQGGIRIITEKDAIQQLNQAIEDDINIRSKLVKEGGTSISLSS